MPEETNSLPQEPHADMRVQPALPPTPARDMSKLYIPGAIIVAGVIIGGCLVFALAPRAASQATTNATTTQPSVNIADVKTAGEPYIGDANAPVTLAYWSDYQCPFCKQFETTVLPTLVSDYVNTGKVKIVFKDFQFLGPDSTADGEYARAIWALYPSEFFAWRTQMYDTQPEENSLSAADNLTRLNTLTASIPGITLSKVQAAVAANKATYDSEMQADEQEGEADGISGTPGFVTGTQLIAGAEPLATFTAALDAQLTK